MTAAPRAADCSSRPARRGVLLLVVLSMLALFLMLGAAYLVAATRARESARAHSRLTFGGDEARIPRTRLLDAVLLKVLRGGGAPVVASGSSPPAVTFESLLADRYGLAATLTGTLSTVTVSGPVASGELVLGGATVQPTDLAGRLLTVTEPGRSISTHRIVRAAAAGVATNQPGNSFSIVFDVAGGLRAFSPSADPCRVIINGREFAGEPPDNESWDGFDAANPFLARVGPGATIVSSTVTRPSYLAAGATLDADNDGDGVLDGRFLDVGLPSTVDAHGNTVQLQASILIVDLDGRFNVNAHDGLPRTIYTGSNFDKWTTAVATGSVPLGSGYGPAEIDGGKMFPTATLNSGLAENPLLFTVVGGKSARQVGLRPTNSRFTAGQSTPRLEALEGRYGEKAPTYWPASSPLPSDVALADADFRFARPGIAMTDDEASRTNDRRAQPQQPQGVNYGIPPLWWTGQATFNWGDDGAGSYPLPRGIFNSPPDLHGRMRTIAVAASGSAVVPTVAFAKPEWSTTGDLFRETRDDPYEIRLDTRRGAGGQLHDPRTDGTVTAAVPSPDNPFTVAELEAVLRPYDVDANRLPPRLVAMLGSVAEEARLKVTTDAWDTTAIVGGDSTTGAAARIRSWLAAATSGTLHGTGPLAGIIGGEVSRGERFDLNRPLAAAAPATAGYDAATEYYVQRQAYFKDLYTLLVALDSAADRATLAQWAANVVEFRDADTRMTPFEYDTNPQNGWSVDGNVTTDDGGERAVVWGVERPEILVTETLAWENATSGGLFVSLHRPWNARAWASGSTSISAETCDPAFDTLSNGNSGKPTNVVDLGKKPHAGILALGTNARYDDVTGTAYPIWRLRIVAGGSTRYLRLDTGTAGADEFATLGLTAGDSKPKLAVDSTLCLASGSTLTSRTGTVTVTLSGSGRYLTGMRVPGTPDATAVRSGTIHLERLSDPSQVPTADTWNMTNTATASLRYVTVDSGSLAVINTGLLSAQTLAGTRRSVASGTTAFWRTGWQSTGSIPSSGAHAFPSFTGSTSIAWMPWPNRPFVSAAELLLVPRGDAIGILQNYVRPTPANQGSVGAPVSLDLLFDAVHVPSRYAGLHVTSTAGLPAETGIFPATTPVNQLSSFREPGRVNLNTVTADDVWNAVVAGPLTAPVVTRSAAGLATTPSRTLAAMLALSGTSTIPVADADVAGVLPVNLNPLHGLYTATRLANTVTPRSNLFAVWVTLREQVTGDPDSVRDHRAFFIIDRSIPVGFEEGRDHNVWDCVRVRRIIE
jgi:hypothetical protein